MAGLLCSLVSLCIWHPTFMLLDAAHAGVPAPGQGRRCSRGVRELEHLTLQYARPPACPRECAHPGSSMHGLGLVMHACAGQLPALEHGIDIVEGGGDENASAEAIVTYLRQQGHDLDAGLNPSQVGCPSFARFTSKSACWLLAQCSGCHALKEDKGVRIVSALMPCRKQTCWRSLLWRSQSWSLQQHTQRGARSRVMLHTLGQCMERGCRCPSTTGCPGANAEQRCDVSPTLQGTRLAHIQACLEGSGFLTIVQLLPCANSRHMVSLLQAGPDAHGAVCAADPCSSNPARPGSWSLSRRHRTRAYLQIYRDAAAVYAALEQRLQSERGGIFFFGSKPSSLDALLYSHLSYHLSAPSSAPELRQAVRLHCP